MGEACAPLSAAVPTTAELLAINDWHCVEFCENLQSLGKPLPADGRAMSDFDQITALQ